MNYTQIYFVTLSVAFVALSINQLLLCIRVKRLERKMLFVGKFLVNRGNRARIGVREPGISFEIDRITKNTTAS